MKRVNRRHALIAAGVASAIAAVIAAGAANLSQDKPNKTEPIYTEFFEPQGSLADMVSAVDAVVLVRFEREDPHDKQYQHEPGPRVMTRYVGDVVEVYKANADHPISPGQNIGIIRQGGKRDRGSFIEDTVQQGFPPFHKHGEYVLFLKWQPAYEGWVSAFGPHGVFEIDGGEVDPLGSATAARAHKGRIAAEFLAELRKVAGH